MKRAYEQSSGNVFADLSPPNPEQELLKAKLTVQIYRIIKDRGLTQSHVAELLGATHALASELMLCRPVSMSIRRLTTVIKTLN